MQIVACLSTLKGLPYRKDNVEMTTKRNPKTEQYRKMENFLGKNNGHQRNK